MKKYLFTCFVSTLFIFQLSLNAHGDGPFKKLGRGFINVLTGWTDGFKTLGEAWDKNHSVPETLGAVPEGMVKAGIRTAIGAYETLTFSVPIPENYEPITEPEYVNLPSPDPERVILRKRTKGR